VAGPLVAQCALPAGAAAQHAAIPPGMWEWHEPHYASSAS
jgi:hypothetical protein